MQTPTKTHDGVEVMAKVSGLSTTTVREIWEEVRDNHARLAACPNHHFELGPNEIQPNPKYVCRHCKGQISASAHVWYLRGRRDGAAAATSVALAKSAST